MKNFSTIGKRSTNAEKIDLLKLFINDQRFDITVSDGDVLVLHYHNSLLRIPLDSLDLMAKDSSLLFLFFINGLRSTILFI